MTKEAVNRQPPSTLYTHFCQKRDGGGAGGPLSPPIIFEGIDLPQQTVRELIKKSDSC